MREKQRVDCAEFDQFVVSPKINNPNYVSAIFELNIIFEMNVDWLYLLLVGEMLNATGGFGKINDTCLKFDLRNVHHTSKENGLHNGFVRGV